MTWTPLVNIGPPSNPKMLARRKQLGLGTQETHEITVWHNDLYEVISTRHKLDPLNLVHLSIKRFDREPVREWRHLQQIKNEVVGPEAEAFEIFPAESRLVDSANQYHLWVFPRLPGMNDEDENQAVIVIPVDPEAKYLVMGYRDRLVSSDEHVDQYNEQREQGLHQGKQEPWEEGLTTGDGRNESPDERLSDLMGDYDARDLVDDEG